MRNPDFYQDGNTSSRKIKHLEVSHFSDRSNILGSGKCCCGKVGTIGCPLRYLSLGPGADGSPLLVTVMRGQNGLCNQIMSYIYINIYFYSKMLSEKVGQVNTPLTTGNTLTGCYKILFCSQEFSGAIGPLTTGRSVPALQVFVWKV